MKLPKPSPDPLPPKLSMDEYVAFVEASLRDRDPKQTARQKDIEKRILARFSISGR